MNERPEPTASRNNDAAARQHAHGRRWGIVVTAVGLILTTLGLYGAIESVWFGTGAQRADAKVVGSFDSSEGIGTLEFTAAGRPYRVPARGAWGLLEAQTDAIGVRITVLYPPERPEDARLAEFYSRYGGPLIAIVLGFMFTPCGVLVLRHGIRMTGTGFESSPHAD
jgi:hypothetical protein